MAASSRTAISSTPGPLTPVHGRRAESRQRRREQLIRATIECIASSGLSGVTMAGVTEVAGLSLGIVNLHFQSKEKLLVETLRYVADEYSRSWRAILEREDNTAADRLRRLVKMDFSSKVASRAKLAVWFAFWGETRSRPLYRRICAEADRQFDRALASTCAELAAECGVPVVDASTIASTYSALSNGLWLDLLVCPTQMRPKKARQICTSYLVGVFGPQFDTALE